MKLQFFLFDIGYIIRNDKPYIQLFGKTPDDKKVCVLIAFEPYFWLMPDRERKIDEVIEVVKKTRRVQRVEQQTKQLLGKKVEVLKVIATLPSDVPLLREEIAGQGKVLEADILFTRRFLIDYKMIPFSLYEVEIIEQVPKSNAQYVDTFLGDTLVEKEQQTDAFHMLSIDIETYNANGKMPNAERDPIVMIGIVTDTLKKVLTWKKTDGMAEWVEVLTDEKAMIERLQEIVQQEVPDAIVGYFSDGFDLPYIIKRAEKCGAEFNISADKIGLKVSKRINTEVSINGISHFDLLNFIRKVHFVALRTPVYTLNAVAKEMLGEEKKEVEITELFKAWDTGEGLNTFLEYNLQDTVLTHKLAKELIETVKAFAKLIGLPVHDVTRMSFSQLVEWYLMRCAPLFNELAPNKPSFSELSARKQMHYAGGFVFEPQPGIYKDIVVFDFLSLYPTLISSHNISPDTLNVSPCENKKEIEDVWFCQDKPGFISTVIKQIIDDRKEVKIAIKNSENEQEKVLLESHSQSLKILANSIYGYFGFFGARWYSGDCAKAITAFGRQHIKQVMDAATNEGFKVVYSDTDSIFITLGEKNRNDAKIFLKKINKELPGIMELEYESYHPAGLFVQTRDGRGAKKRYAMLNEDNTIKVRGFQTVRRNSSIIGRETQKEILSRILRGEEKEESVAYIKQVIEDLRTHKTPVAKTIITTQLQREPEKYSAIGPHVRIAERMRAKGQEVTPGDIISYVVTREGQRIRDKARLPEEVTEQDYDAEYYIERQIIPAVEQIIELIGATKEDLLNNHTQGTLEGFL